MTRTTKNPLISYLSGTATPLQSQQVENWKNSSQANLQLYQQIAHAWKQGDEGKVKELLLKKQQQEQFQPDEDAYVPHDFVPHAFPNGYKMMFARIAAGILVVASIYFLFESKFDAVLDKAYPKMVHVQNTESQDLRLQLDHVAEVLLKTASELKYPAQIDDFMTEIDLKGQAEFNVLPTENAEPIRFRMKPVILELSAGKFQLNQMEDAKTLEIFVEEGELTFQADKEANPLHVGSGHKLIYGYQDQSISTEELYSDMSY